MLIALHLLALALYVIAAALLGVSFTRGKPQLSRVATAFVAAGVLVHLWSLAQYTSYWGELPLVGLGPCLSSIALMIAIGSFFAAMVRDLGPVGLVLVPLAALLIGAAAVVGIAPMGEATAYEGPWFALHVVFAFIGYTGLAVAFAAGLMYLLQFRELKTKHFGSIFRFFPPLDTLDRLGRRGLLIGFPFLTLALTVGWAWTERFETEAAARNSEVIWGVLTWAVFLLALGSRLGGGRRGRRGAVASVVGFVVVVIAYVVLRIGASQAGGFL